MMPITIPRGDWDFDSTDEHPYFLSEQTFNFGTDFYTSLMPSDDIWKKFELLDTPMSNNLTSSDSSTDDDSELDALLECGAASGGKDAREIRHHDCMWAGRCGSKDHIKKVVAEGARPTARKTKRVMKNLNNNNITNEPLVAVLPVLSTIKTATGTIETVKCTVVRSASLLKTDLNVTTPAAGRSLLRTPIKNSNILVTTNSKKDISYSLESDGGSPRPDTPQTSESEDDNDEHFLFKHNLDISSAISSVCSDDSNDILNYSEEYRTQTSLDGDEDDDCEEDNEDEDIDDEDFDELPSPSTAVAVSEVTGQLRPTVLHPQPATVVKRPTHFTSDHSYHLSKTAVRLDNLGVQTPSDSEEEIDVVSFDGEQPTSRSSSCGGNSLPTNPSDLDRQQLQLAVNSAITKKKNTVAKAAAEKTDENKNVTVRTIKKEVPETKSVYASKVKNTKKRTATSIDREDDKVRYKGVKRAKHQYHHRLQHHKMMSPVRAKKASSTGSVSPRSGCSGSSDSEPESLERRSLHNNMERQRRIDLRNLVEGLRLMVPSVENKSRAAKVIILREASNYCQDLTEQYEEATCELAALRAKQNRLRAKVSALRREAAKVR